MPLTTLGYHVLKSFAFILEKSYGKCPNCNSKLLKRNGKYGVFVGCSKYPRCKYTRDLKK